jgi:general secretion pathway protein K
MVLWVAAALGAIALSVASSVRSETSRVSGAADGLRASYLASGSVERGIQWMLWGPDFAPKFWQPNRPRLYFSYPSGDVVVEMIPETAKLNINTANPDDLLRLVTAVGGNTVQASEIVQAIQDWRGGSGGSAFDQFYASVGASMGAPTFHARHASFQEIEELLLVRGMTPELFYGNYIADNQGRLYASGGLRDCLSIWGTAGPFDVNTMSPALMQAVGVPAAGAAAIVAHRQIAPFANMGEVGDLGFPTPRLTIGGGHAIWTLRATARLRRPDGSPSEIVRTASATVKTFDPRRNPYYEMMPVRVLRWYDDAWSQDAVAPPGILQPMPGVPQP